MNDAPPPPDRTDDELATLDITVLLRYGLTAGPGPRRTALMGDGAAAAAVILDRLGTEPRSVAFLADTVRAAWAGPRLGAARAAAPPGGGRPRQGVAAVGAELVAGIAADDTAATWLRAVATIIELKQLTRARGQGT